MPGLDDRLSEIRELGTDADASNLASQGLEDLTDAIEAELNSGSGPVPADSAGGAGHDDAAESRDGE